MNNCTLSTPTTDPQCTAAPQCNALACNTPQFSELHSPQCKGVHKVQCAPQCTAAPQCNCMLWSAILHNAMLHRCIFRMLQCTADVQCMHCITPQSSSSYPTALNLNATVYSTMKCSTENWVFNAQNLLQNNLPQLDKK